jgi:phosphohistidine phosphatase SixA
MKICLLLLSFTVLLSCSSSRYYVVRHAEKGTVPAGSSMMANNPPLSEAGIQRAQTLKKLLQTKKIGYIFSTNTIRTQSTAEPTRSFFNLQTTTYNPMPDSTFITKLKALKKNTLIVGHSNTVDDIVNKLSGKINIPADLPETAFDNLYILKKKGKKILFYASKYGVATP